MLHAYLENALRVLLHLGIDFSADLHHTLATLALYRAHLHYGYGAQLFSE